MTALKYSLARDFGNHQVFNYQLKHFNLSKNVVCSKIEYYFSLINFLINHFSWQSILLSVAQLFVTFKSHCLASKLFHEYKQASNA